MTTPLGVWAVVVAACLVMLIPLPEEPPINVYNAIRAGMLYGAMWGQITAAAAWFAFRPASWFVRARDSLLWCGAIYVCLTITLYWNTIRLGDWIEFSSVMGACLCGQWLLIQAPLWILRRFHATGPLQFGMRHLLLFTTVIGAVLGVGRILILSGILIPPRGNLLMIVGLITIASLLSTLPTVLAVWMPRWTAAALVLALLFGGGVLAAEVQWWRQFQRNTELMLVGIHAFQIGWILVLGVVVRAYGYRLIRSRETSFP